MVTLAQGDIGPKTPAALAGTTIMVFREDNGAEFRRKYRDHALEIMARSKHRNGKPRQPEISTRQRDAGLRLHEAYCRTELSGDAPFTKVYVDVSPDPSAVALSQAERVTEYAKLMSEIPSDLRGPVWHVAVMSKMLRAGYSKDGKEAAMHKAQLQVALDLLANHLRL